MTEERFASFSLMGLLPEDSKIVVNRDQRILTQLRSTECHCEITEQQSLSDVEVDLLLALFEWYPHHTPIENMLSAYSGQPVEKCRKRIHRALEEGNLSAVMSQARNRLSNFRPKLYLFGLNVRSIPEVGYMLMPDTGQRHANRKEWDL